MHRLLPVMLFLLAATLPQARAVENNPMDDYHRGKEKAGKGDVNGALKDYALAIQGYGENKEAGMGRSWQLQTICYESAMLRYHTGDLPGALDDFEHYVILPIAYSGKDWALYYPDQAQLTLWIIRSKLGKKEEAATGLTAYLIKRTGSPSPYNHKGEYFDIEPFATNAKYFLGQATEEQLDHVNIEERYWPAMKHLLSGDRQGCLDLLRKTFPANNPAPDDRAIYARYPEIKALEK